MPQVKHQRSDGPRLRPSTAVIFLHSILCILLFSLGVLSANAQSDDLSLILPSTVAQCETVRLSWTGGTPAYTVVIVSNSSLAAQTFLPLEDRSVDWPVKFRANATVSIELTDGAGLRTLAEVTVGPSTNSSCLPTDSSQTPPLLPTDVIPDPELPLPSVVLPPPVADTSGTNTVPLFVGIPIAVFVAIASGVTALCIKDRRRRRMKADLDPERNASSAAAPWVTASPSQVPGAVTPAASKGR